MSNLSIKNKLRFIILGTSAVVLLLASFAVVIGDLITFRRQMVADLLVLADMVGTNSIAGLTFNDSLTVEENIAGLKANSHIVLVHIFAKDGTKFVSYVNEKSQLDNMERYFTTVNDYYTYHNIPKPEKDNFKGDYFWESIHVDILKPIIFKNKIIGTVYIQSDIKALKDRLFWGAMLVVAVMFVSLLLAFGLASRLQRVITTPIYNLLKTMKAVSEDEDYSHRAPKKAKAHDELGNLVDGFNNMLTKIEMRDRELSHYHDRLSEMVEQRTAELQRRTTELAQARDEALAANKAKSAFLANMSHELRTPLNGILGYAQILIRDKSLSTHHKEGVDVIQRSGEYLLTLISDILDLSKVEAGKLEIMPTDFNFSTFFNGIAELFKMRASQREIAFVYKADANLPTAIHADEKRLRQILINLLGNAIKFTKQGTVTFKVDYNQGKIYFGVTDTGIGIAKDELERIFLPFQQSGDIYHKAEGTGLGLSITKKLVNMMGGELHVESVLGEGSTFGITLNLPAVEDSHFVQSVAEKPVIIGYKIPHAQLKSYKILVIDDQLENRIVLLNLLTPLGFEMLEAVDGIDGVDKAREWHPDLIIMDLMMPKMDGFEATSQIRKISELKEVPIIVASASVFEYDHQKSLKAGCNDFMDKPIKEGELLELMDKYLNLQWIYEECSDGKNISDVQEKEQVLREPSSEQASILFNLAMMGDIAGIEAFAEELEQSDVLLAPFAKKISTLVNHFELEKLQEIAQQYIGESG